nr:hypothetical protein [Tanacetum cinerariifolium]
MATNHINTTTSKSINNDSTGRRHPPNNTSSASTRNTHNNNQYGCVIRPWFGGGVSDLNLQLTLGGNQQPPLQRVFVLNVSNGLGFEKMGIHVDKCDMNYNGSLDPGMDECDVPNDVGPKPVSVLSDKECLDDGSISDDETVIANESASKENKRMLSSENTYASATKSSSYFETNKLLFVRTEINKTGEKVAVFDEELVELGSKKWELTLCGHLIGHYMSLPALNNHLRRMWYRYDIKEIVDNGNGNWLFMFTNEKDVYMEGWTTKGISEISSSVGKPMIMDNMTAYVCKNGVGRTEFARVLVEVDADKGFKEIFELQYRDKQKQVNGTKTVMVVYDWSLLFALIVLCLVMIIRIRSWEAGREKEKDIRLDELKGIVEDVLEDEYEVAKNLVADEVNKVGCSILN